METRAKRRAALQAAVPEAEGAEAPEEAEVLQGAELRQETDVLPEEEVQQESSTLSLPSNASTTLLLAGSVADTTRLSNLSQSPVLSLSPTLSFGYPSPLASTVTQSTRARTNSSLASTIFVPDQSPAQSTRARTNSSLASTIFVPDQSPAPSPVNPVELFPDRAARRGWRCIVM
jgi:hypothetical protein